MTQLPRPALAAFAAALALAAFAAPAGAQPATPENARILTPSVSSSAPQFGGKAVLSSTTGPVAPVQDPMQTAPTPPTLDEPAPLPLPSYSGTTAPAPVGEPAYTREVITRGDVVVLPDGGGTVTTQETVRVPANVPRKGSSMAQVRAAYGPPQAEYKTGGGSRAQPPITRWTYPGFNVVFEYTHAVDVVVPGAPPPLVRTGGLTSRPVNPASPKYKGTPGRALRLRAR